MNFSNTCCKILCLILGKVKFNVKIMESTGIFEISERNTLTCHGCIYQLTTTIDPVNREQVDFTLISSDIYKELRLRGYDYGTDFRGIHRTTLEGRFFFRI